MTGSLVQLLVLITAMAAAGAIGFWLAWQWYVREAQHVVEALVSERDTLRQSLGQALRRRRDEV